MSGNSVKYLFVTGGVLSSLGKGITAASIGALLESRGIRIAMLKLDPYLNVDPGTMNPFQHGEVYVTDDGAETDLDLGHYYRYTNSPLSKASTATSGQVYETVIRKERKGDYLGKTVQVIPHVTNEIKRRILATAQQEAGTEVVIVEIGGTVGDIESLPFLEAIRQLRLSEPTSSLTIHLTYVPFLKVAGEVKTKPTQHSVQALRAIGIIPDLILCRSEFPLSEEVKEKISLFCGVPLRAVFDEPDVSCSIYEVPLTLSKQGLDVEICKLLQLADKKAELAPWEKLLESMQHPKGKVVIGIVGKYLEHRDAYKSVFEALNHAAISLGKELQIISLESDRLKEGDLGHCDGYLIPGGFGERGWEGKISAARYCRENRVPYFGLCLGMQVLLVEFARHVLELEGANSTEIDPKTPHPVISLLSEQKEAHDMGGTMRLGAYPCRIQRDTRAFDAYGKDLVHERHRHRYECNNSYRRAFESKGLVFSGILDNGTLCEIAEVKDHPWMLGAQFHPEFQSRPLMPHPLFVAFLSACKGKK
ncbi:MAG: CTP synthase [Verrucomicrobiota bacterium]|nr:CTP synthase [Verrucomicrobiota bacterium]